MEQHPEPSTSVDIEHLAAQLERAMTTLARTEERLHAPQIMPGETKFRDPKNAYHQITLGAVLVRYDLSADHARSLDGLLSMTFDQAMALLDEATSAIATDKGDEDGKTVGSALLELLELMPGKLDQFGRHAEWRRGLEQYMAKTRPYLEGLTEADLERLATRSPSKKQLHLIRTTCAYHRIAFPAVPNRRAAFEWLRDIGANAKYREMQS